MSFDIASTTLFSLIVGLAVYLGTMAAHITWYFWNKDNRGEYD